MTNGHEPVAERVEDLLDRMTLEEKAGQCCGTFVGRVGDDSQTIEDSIELIDTYQIGFASPFGIAGSPNTDPREVVEVTNRLQRHAIEESRLGIPLLVPVDAIHGHAYVDGATVFPHNIGLGATWDPDVARRVAQITAREVRATGGHQNYGPTCDVTRDPRWGRTFETFGESPRLCADMAAEKVRGMRELDGEEDVRVLTTAKHFPAYGRPERGEDASPVDVSPATLRRTFLPPFEAVIEAGADAVMPCYNAVNHVPAHGSERYLSVLLRENVGFEGLIISDWGGVAMLHEDHRVTDSLVDSVRRATGAGVDVISIGGADHAAALHDAVTSGSLPEERLDESVRRILTTKFRLGLFDDPYVDPGRATSTLGRDDHRAVAFEAARKSLTLLQNDGLLPFTSAVDELLVTGPNADDPVAQVGGWSVESRDGVAGATIREAIEDAAPAGTTVTYESGTTDGDAGSVGAATAAAAAADAAVVVLGEGWYIHEFATRGGKSRPDDFPSRLDLTLPEPQRRLLRGVRDTGTPVAVVLVAGRPLAVPWAAANVPAILWAYFPGTEGGRAVADVLFGDCDPGGRLPISVPRSAGHLPTLHDYLPHPRPVGDEIHPPSYDPLFAFGHGMSYTEFEYADLSVSPERISIDGTVEATVTVENVGERVGEEVVQFYLRDDVSSRVTPVRELCGFERIRLAPDEDRTVSVRLGPDELGVVLEDDRSVVEPGTFTVICADRTASFEATDG